MKWKASLPQLLVRAKFHLLPLPLHHLLKLALNWDEQTVRKSVQPKTKRLIICVTSGVSILGQCCINPETLH